jgi:hypothetical protein
MNSATTRQQSKQRNAVQRVRVAAPRALTAANRQRALGSLVRCLKTNPSRQKWSKAHDSALLGLWPNFKTLPHFELMSALEQWGAIVKEARATTLSPKQLLLNHQAAVNSLLELSMARAWPDAPVAVPFDQVPALFRAVVEQDKAAGSRNPYPKETDLIEHALMLIDRNGGDATIRTPEQEQFYADLAFRFDDDQFRVRYSPKNVTVH